MSYLQTELKHLRFMHMHVLKMSADSVLYGQCDRHTGRNTRQTAWRELKVRRPESRFCKAEDPFHHGGAGNRQQWTGQKWGEEEGREKRKARTGRRFLSGIRPIVVGKVLVWKNTDIFEADAIC